MNTMLKEARPSTLESTAPSGHGIAVVDGPGDRIGETTTSPPRPDGRRGQEAESAWQHWRLTAAAVGCWAFLILAFGLDRLAATPHGVVVGLYVASYLAGGTFATIKAMRNLSHRHLSVDLLMVTAALGAAFINAWAEGAILLGLFSASNALEYHALGRTRRAVRALMELSPEVATVLRPGTAAGEATIPVDALTLADVLLVRPGERFATDGTILIGSTAVDQSAITGESMPGSKRPGSSVFAGTINGRGAVQVRVSKLPRESTLARITGFVEAAQAAKSRAQRFTDAFEGWYAGGVMLFAMLVGVVPIVVLGQEPGAALYRAMTLLVVASPCALVISTPASTLSALANAARRGVLFKGASHLEATATVEIVAFDKTGTLTEGRPRVTDIVAFGPWSEIEVLKRGACAERLSEHPLAEAIVGAAQERNLPLTSASAFEAVPGKGILARVGDEEVVIGNEPLFRDLGVPLSPDIAAALDDLRSAGKTVVLAGDRCAVYGLIAIADVVRPQAAQVIRELKRLGVRRTAMLTGDSRLVGQAIAKPLGVDEVLADLLPEEKLVKVEELMAEGPVIMVGDGVNDAPALATATVGVAMGAAGTDAALETADVVLMADDLTAIPYAIELSRRTRRIIRQNLAFSLAVIVVLAVSTLTIGIPLPLGVVGHEGSTVLVVLNGLRLLAFSPTGSVDGSSSWGAWRELGRAEGAADASQRPRNA